MAVLAYLTRRGERELIVALPPSKRPAVNTRDGTEIDTAADRWAAKMHKDREERLKKAKSRLMQDDVAGLDATKKQPTPRAKVLRDTDS